MSHSSSRRRDDYEAYSSSSRRRRDDRDSDNGERRSRDYPSSRKYDDREHTHTERVNADGYGYGERERERERQRDRDRYDKDRGRSSRRSASPRRRSGSRSPSPRTKKYKPNFGASGLLAAETNTVKSVDGKNSTVLKYNEPPEARKPILGWRLYVFKGDEQQGPFARSLSLVWFLRTPDLLHVHRQSAYLFGRDRLVADIFVDHPSCSKQHAAIQCQLYNILQPNCLIRSSRSLYTRKGRVWLGEGFHKVCGVFNSYSHSKVLAGRT